MEGFDQTKKNEELETERKKLQDIKQLIKKALEQGHRDEENFATEEIHHLKKIRNLMSVRASLEQKAKDLESEIEATERAVEKKIDEVKALSECKKEKKAEPIEKMENCLKEYWETVAELERQVKREYAEYQNDRETKILMEMVQETISEENERPFAMEMLKKREEYAQRRQEDLKKAKEELNKEESSISEEVEKMKGKLDLLKQKYLSLYQVYIMAKEAKDAVQEVM